MSWSRDIAKELAVRSGWILRTGLLAAIVAGGLTLVLPRSWEATAHGRALETLREVGEHETPDCLLCHTTAYGRLSGYRGIGTPHLEGVGCESCHGPGGDHLTASADLARATVYGLATDCDTCRTEAVCRTCHDQENDPDFQLPGDLARTVHPHVPVP